WMPAAPSTAAGRLPVLGRVILTSRWSSSPRTGRGCGTSRGAALMAIMATAWRWMPTARSTAAGILTVLRRDAVI
ncbi:MAG TPA: hypothetical protein VMV49_18435, partial [Candidatus Deferrimicrobium sp.]|nr:hypothetical protein [Candidatus Deferrimicrobium sp.]